MDGEGRSQKTFSAFSDVARFDERGFVDEVARATGATCHSVVPQPEALLAEIDRLTWRQDEPFGSTSIFAQSCVFRLARDHGATVMLDGQGADEALGGYHGYFWPRLAGLLRTGHGGAFWREARQIRELQGQSWSTQAQFLADELMPSWMTNRLRAWRHHPTPRPAFLDLRRLGAVPADPRRAARDRREPVRALSRAQLTSTMLPMLLHCEDRNSMAHGIEARLPFLDYRLVEFCVGLPEDFKIAEGWTKRVLREGMRARLPENIRLRRDKLGFATAEEVWMRERPETFLHLVDEAIDASRGILTAATRTRARRMLAGEEPFGFFVWRMLNFGTWLKRFDIRVEPTS